MIAVEGYIHYYEDSEGVVLKDIKQSMNIDWYAGQHRKNRKLLNQRENDLNKDLSLNFQEIQNDLSNIFSNQNLDSVDVGLYGETITGPKGGEYSATSVAKDLSRLLSNNTEQLNTYLDLLSNVLEKIDFIHEKLGLAQVSSLILNHAQNPDVEVAKYLMSKEGQELHISEENVNILAGHYESLQTAIYGLKNFNTGMVSSKAKTEAMQDLLKSIRGALNGTKGILLESELYAGLCQASFQGLDMIDIEMTGAMGRQKKDPKMEADKQIFKEGAENHSKTKKNPNSDLTLTVGGNGGTATIGISVKNHHTDFNSLPSEKNKYDFAQTLGLGSKANLYEQIQKASYKLAALTGVDPIFYGQQAFGIHKRGSAGAQAGTASYWEDYLDAVAVLNVLDRLAGEGGYGNFSRFLVLNGYVFSMDDILLSISKNPDQVYGFSLLQYTGRGINSWRKKEKGERDRDAALRRSNEVKGEMIERWKSATLSTKINLAILANI